MGRRISYIIIILIFIAATGLSIFSCDPIALRQLVEERVNAAGGGGLPIIDIGTYPEYIASGAILNGSATDTDGDALTLTWSEVSNHGIVFGDADAGDSSISFNNWSNGNFVIDVTLKLTVSDGTNEVEAEVTIKLYNANVVFMTTDGTGNGSAPDSPRGGTIPDAISFANANGKSAVAIAAGTYNGNSASGALITLVQGISLYGGYTTTSWSRDPDVNTTTIIDNSASGGTVIESLSGITSVTVVDGFILQPATDGASPAIGIEIAGGGSSPIIRNNTINAGSSAGSACHGIQISSASPIIQSNIINGGNVPGGQSSYGITSSNSNPIIERNTIDGGTGGGFSYGIYVNGGEPEIRNNTIAGGGGITETFGIDCSESMTSVPIIRNNTIDAGNGMAANTGIRIYETGSSPRIENNIIYCTSSMGTRRGIVEFVFGGTPTSVDNNNVAPSCVTGLYYDLDGAAPNDKVEAFMGNFTDTGGAFPMQDPTGTGNVSYNPFFQPGGDDDLYLGPGTHNDVLTGGIDGATSGWGFNTDKDGNPRTGNGSTGWSMGAYEYDP